MLCYQSELGAMGGKDKVSHKVRFDSSQPCDGGDDNDEEDSQEGEAFRGARLPHNRQ